MRQEDRHPPDRGCLTATAFLGRQSSCVECPFERCIDERPGVCHAKELRNEKILLEYGEGVGVKKLATAFCLSERTIEKVVKCSR